MGPAINALVRAVGTTVEHPRLLLGVGGVGTIVAAVSVAVGYIPFIGAIINMVVITPLMLAALLTMSYAAVRGTPSFGDLTNGVERYWKSMMGAFAILFGVYTVVGVAAVFLFFVAFLGTGAAASGDPDPELFAALGTGMIALAAVFFLAVVLVGMIVQFIDVSIVVGGASATSSFAVAWKVFRTKPLSVVGFSLLRGLVLWIPVLGVTAVAWGLGYVVFGEEAVWGIVALVALALLVTYPIILTISFVYHVTYFDQVNEQYGITA